MNGLNDSAQLEFQFNLEDAPTDFPALQKRINSIMKDSDSSKLSNHIDLQYQDSQGVSYDISNNQDYRNALLNSSTSGSRILKVAFKEAPKQDDFQVNTQELENLLLDFSEMPECAEKHLLTLQYLAKLKQVNSFQDNLPPFNFKETFDKLRQRSSLERLQIPHLNSCEAQFANEEWKSASQSLVKFLSEIRSLNIREIIRLVEKSQNSVHLASKQDIALFFGPTGSGKSTTIHFLAGSEMAQEEGSGHIFPSKHGQGLHRITVSASTKSETRYVTSVTVNCIDIKGSIENATIILCDAPGRGDTAGAEVDIANSVSTQRVIQSSKSVRPVFVLSSKGFGDRLQGIRELVGFLKEMIPDAEDFTKSFIFMFTKFPQDQRQEINASIKILIRDLKETGNADKTDLAILEDMLEKTSEKNLIAIDPIKDNEPGFTLDKIVTTREIARPNEVFQFALCENSKSIVREQIYKHKHVILKALERADVDLTKYKLEELQSLKEFIPDEKIKELIENCFKEVKNFIKEEYQRASSKINTCMKEDNSLSESEFKEFKEKSLQLKALTDLIKEEEGFDLVKNLEKHIETLLQNIQTRNFDDPIMKSASEKLQLISKYFPEFQQSCAKANIIIQISFNKACKTYSDLFTQEKFQESEAELTKIKQFSLSSSNDYFSKKYQQLKDALISHVKSTIPEPILKKYTLAQEDIEIINSSLSKLDLLKTAYIQGNHISKEEFESVLESYSEKILPFFERLVQTITKQMESQSVECLTTIRESFNQLRLIRNIELVKSRTDEAYFEIVEKLKRLTQEISRKIAENLDVNNKKINSVKISSLLRLLSKNQWIEEGLYSRTLNDIQEEASNFNSDLKESLHTLISSSSSIHEIYKWIQEAYQIITTTKDMSCFEEVLPDLEAQRLDIVNFFEEKISSYHHSITQVLEQYKVSNSLVELPEFEKEKLEKFLLYAKACESIPRAAVKNSNIPKDLEKFLRKYRDILTKTFTDCFFAIDEYRQNLVSGNTEEPSSAQDLSVSVMSTGMERKVNNMKENVKTISECLKFVYETKSQCPCLYEIFDSQQKLMPQWQRMLIQDLHDEITENLNMLKAMQKIKSLRRMLVLVKALRLLDEYLPEKNEYRKLYSDFQNQVPEKAKEKKEDVIKAINAGEYENIQFLMDDFMADPEDEGENYTEKKLLNDIQTKLRQNVEKIIDETEEQVGSLRKTENITYEKFNQIVKNLKKLRKIFTYTSPWIEAKTFERLQESEPQTKKLIADRLRNYLESIRYSMSQFDFKKANEQKENLMLIIEVLGLYCEEDVQTGFNGLDDFEEEKLKELREKFTDINITGYPGSNTPKAIFAKLLESVHTKPAVYQRVFDKLEQNILQAFKKELQEPTPKKLKDVQNYCENYLPESLAGRIKLMILECQDKLDAAAAKEEALKAKQEQPKLIEDHKLNDEPPKNSPPKNSPLKNSLPAKSSQLSPKEALLAEIKELEDTIRENFLIKNVQFAIGQLTTLAGKYSELVEKHNQEYQSDGELDKILLKTFNQSLRAFLAHFKDPSTKTLTVKTVQAAEDDFACFMEFIELQLSAEGFLILKEDHLKSFESALTKVQQAILIYFSAFQTDFHKALEALKIPEVSSLMQYLREIQPIISTILKYTSRNPNLKDFSGSLQEIWTEKEMVNMLKQRITKIEKEVLNADFLDVNQLNSEAAFNAFYDQIRMKLLKLLEIQDHKELSIDAKSIYEGLTKDLLEKKALIYDVAKDCLKHLFTIVADKNPHENACKKFLIHYGNINSFEKFLVFPRSKAAPCNLRGLENEFQEELNNLINSIIEALDLEASIEMQSELAVLADSFVEVEALYSKVKAKVDELVIMIEGLVG